MHEDGNKGNMKIRESDEERSTAAELFLASLLLRQDELSVWNALGLKNIHQGLDVMKEQGQTVRNVLSETGSTFHFFINLSR